MIILAKYNTAMTLRFPLIKAGSQNFAASGDYTHASGDVKISKDGGSAATATNAPAALTMGAGGIWTLDLTATELSAAEVVVTIIDTATKAVEDQAFVIHTYGNASARHPFDLGTALASQTVGTVNALAADSITATAIATDALGSLELAAGAATEIATAVLDAAIAEPSAVPTWPASIRTILQWMLALARNKTTQTATTTLVRNDADSGTIGTSTVSDNGTTFVRGEFG